MQIKAMAQAMLHNGISIEMVAQAMNKTVEEVESLL